MVGLPDKGKREQLRRLHCPEVRAFERGADLSLLYQFYRVFHWNSGGNGLVVLHCLQASFENRCRHKRACAVVNHNPTASGSKGSKSIQTGTNRILSSYTPNDHMCNFLPSFMLTQG